jgi:hypothetical protein
LEIHEESHQLLQKKIDKNSNFMEAERKILKIEKKTKDKEALVKIKKGTLAYCL